MTVAYILQKGDMSSPSHVTDDALWRRKERIWIPDVPLWRRSLGISTTGVAGGLLNAYHMHRRYVLLIFRWLIFVYTLSDP